MPRAVRLPSGSYRARAYSHSEPILDANGNPVLGKDGKPKLHKVYESFTAPTRREAEYRASEYTMQRNRKQRPENLTLSEAIDLYIEGSDGVLSPTTVQEYRKIKRNYFKGLMHVPLRLLTEEALQQAVNAEAKRPAERRKKSGQDSRPATLSPKTIANAYGLVSVVLGKYYPSLQPHIKLPARINTIKELIPPDTIMEVIRGTDIELPCLLAMWLSFSRSEVRGLTKSKSISPDGNYITIREVVVDVNGKPLTKPNGKEFYRNRRHRIPPYIKQLIALTDPAEDRLVPMSGQTIYRHWSQLLEVNGLPHMTFHDLRHVNASVMALLRVPDKYAQERGGWKTDQVMKQVYQQTFSPEREAVDDAMDNYFESILRGAGS